MIDDTIVAIATPHGWGGIGIVRISGSTAFNIIEKIFVPHTRYNIKQIKTQTIKYGHIVDPKNNELIDEVLVSFFKEPNTYTRENITEINCHGGALIVKKILDIIAENGARIAEPGEFTKRAFLNGRIDLSQAEAVIEVINSKTDAARKASLNQLEGKLSGRIKNIRNLLVSCIADIEAVIDYPEYDIEEVSLGKLEEMVKICLEQINNLKKTFFEGKIIREGIVVAIVGKPNVGKSSLLNALTQKEKAIITEIPGTTRDIIEEFIEIGEVAVKILDTAGLRETDDIVEKMGIDRTKAAIEKAELILFVLDGSKSISEEDIEIFEMVRDKKVIVLINKTDLSTKISDEEIDKYIDKEKRIEISAKEELGLEKIEEIIKEMFLKRDFELDNEIIVTNVRHKKIIDKVKLELEQILIDVKNMVPIDLISVSITEATNDIGEITGETVNDEILHTIFQKFCIGK